MNHKYIYKASPSHISGWLSLHDIELHQDSISKMYQIFDSQIILWTNVQHLCRVPTKGCKL